jgi:hypothetical protein
MVHSKVAIFSSAQAARTMLTACVSSAVSITTIGVDELISILRRSSPSVMIGPALRLDCHSEQSLLRSVYLHSLARHAQALASS